MPKILKVAPVMLLLLGCQTTKYNDLATMNSPRNTAQVPDQKFDRLASYAPYKYEVLFTDPVCGVYNYNQEMLSIGGQPLKQKPENVYCKNLYDLKRSGSRSTSPQYRIIEWINLPDTREIFFTYLSFRNKAVKNALCEAAKRGVKISFVMSSTEDATIADELIACAPENVKKKTRGMEGGIGYAHNKFFIVNPNTTNEFKIVFSSGNMTSGPVIHHENWNFITTNVRSHFAQSHLCAMRAEWNDATGRERGAYIKSIRECRKQIAAPEEKDIKVFFVPGEGEYEKGINDGRKTASEYLINGHEEFPGIMTASRIWLACHRFFYGKMIGALNKRMSSQLKPELRIVADDDTYFKANDPDCAGCGDTMAEEYYKMDDLAKYGAQLKFMETNADEHQLHHSKYLIFADKNNKFTSVFTGSANLTGAGFKTNWENSYYVMIPEVVKAFADHYVKTWDVMATSIPNLPQKGLVTPYLDEQPVIKN